MRFKSLIKLNKLNNMYPNLKCLPVDGSSFSIIVRSYYLFIFCRTNHLGNVNGRKNTMVMSFVCQPILSVMISLGLDLRGV